LFWRGFIVNQLEAAGQSSQRAILFSAIGFSLVHGIFLPDKLISTFLLWYPSWLLLRPRKKIVAAHGDACFRGHLKLRAFAVQLKFFFLRVGDEKTQKVTVSR